MKYFFVFLLTVWVSFDALADTYVVTPNFDDYLSAVIELTLDHPPESDTTFGTRSVGGVAPTISDASCTYPAGTADVAVQGLYWIVPRDCLQISWSISFCAIRDRTYELSNQESFYHPKGWWYLNESGSLLRYTGQNEATLCALVLESKKCTHLSPLDRAPTFLMFGKPERVFSWQGKTIEVYTGNDAEYLGLEPTMADFAVALERIDAMTASISVPDERSSRLQFVWLGIDSDQNWTGGAAGNGAFLSNFRINGNTVTEVERSRLLIISGHEYVHMIGVNAGSQWVTETLATYYGFKAIGSVPSAQKAFEEMAYVEHPDVPVMVRGAALWRDLDEAITQFTEGQDSLDDLLPLLTDPFESETSLPAEFLSLVAEKIGQSRLDTILSNYF
ncbi:MAG: hypothetical protein AB7O54_11395 [Pseudomonadales bacterium]